MAIGRDGTGYAVVPRQDGHYAVQVIKPGDVPRLVTGFDNEGEAENWILQQLQPPPGTLHNVTTAP
jgi:hypothetical protein